MNKLIGLLTAVLVTVVSLNAQTTWKADKAHSNVSFSVSHMVISEVTGMFRDFDVTVVASKDDFSDAQIEATIKTAGIFTDNDYRDKHLRSDDFFNAEKYPDIKFKSTKIEKTANGIYNITGDLTIRDVTKPVVLETKYNGQMKLGENTKAGFKATTTIDRFVFGTKWNKALETGGLVAGKDVGITLLMELNKEVPEAKGK